ncbi:MAG: Ribonuclease R [Steroidobacteraceae bacterium]|nr:Ribonuclease R [Steroidobacteraceae bacterium]
MHASGASSRAKVKAATGPMAQGPVEGTVSAHRAGYGFARVEGMTDSVFIRPAAMSMLMHGDRIRLTVKRDHTGRYSGEVLGVVAHGVRAFLGTIDVEGRTAWVASVDRRLALRCQVAAADLGGAQRGDWVIAEVTQYRDAKGGAKARVRRRLDPDRPIELATESAIARFGVPAEFPAAACAEAARWGETVDAAEVARRVDLRALPLVTIDGEDARDFDDAVYAEPHPDGFRLIVAIADVSHYVRPGGALDKEAQERGTSVYFPRRVIPMLPAELSDHLCSLQPRVDRLCFAADMVVTKQGQLKDARFYPAVMHSAARLTYSQAFAALFEGRAEARAALGALTQRLLPLVDLYRALNKARQRRGALDFDAPEARFDIDAQDRVRGIVLASRNDAHRLIEECMILANVAVALELGRQRIGTLYRVHGKPEEEKLDRLLATLAALGIPAEIPENVTPRDIRQITQRLGSSPTRPFVESLVVRSMPQAIYQSANIGHFGLALKAYAHFTSPIRRYPDLVVHRTLKARLGVAPPVGIRYGEEELARLGESTSRLEKRADEADRYVDLFLKCCWLRERLGQTFEGLVTTVVEFGCFVQLLEIGADGLLHTAALNDDVYELDAGGHAWVGRKTKRRLGLGERIRVTVTNANPVEGLIDLELA